MKTRTLRNAISLALLAVASGAAGAVGARAATAQVATQPPEAAQKTPAAVAPNAGEPPRPGSPEAAIAAGPPVPTATTELESIEVTGTRIKGGAVPSPVISISAARIQEEDFSDLGEVIRSVPQNFSGGQNPGVLSGNLAGAGNANQNMTGGASLNLRGLGADATLTLLNGRRLAMVDSPRRWTSARSRWRQWSGWRSWPTVRRQSMGRTRWVASVM